MCYEFRIDLKRKSTTVPPLFMSGGSLRSEVELRQVSSLCALESVGSPREEEDLLSHLTISITKYLNAGEALKTSHSISYFTD